MNKTLANVRILDLSRVLAGPLGSMILADLGADVIRIEAPEGKDDMRSWAPFYKEESTYYLCANRNKRSMTINLKTDQGKEIFKKLLKDADIVLENFRTGTLKRLGIDYPKLKEVNDKIILCSVTGYGQTGPYKYQPGYDPVIQAVGGLMDVTGHPDGEAMRVGVPVVDMMTSHYVAIGILAALRHRDKYGVGQHIDLSLLDVQVSALGNIASSYLLNGTVHSRIGNKHGNIAPYESFQCKDQSIVIAAGNDRLFAQLCKALHHPEWSSDPRFLTNPDRLTNRKELKQLIEGELQKETVAYWIKRLMEYEVPCGEVNNIEQVFEHPQVQSRKMVEETAHPKLGSIRLVKSPLQFSNEQLTVDLPPPLLGEHTEEILREELRYSAEQIEQLKNAHII